MNTDSISDMLTRIRNAQSRKSGFVEMPYSKLKEEIAKLIVQTGFASDVKVFKAKDSKFKGMSISLKYNELMEPAISKIERVSKSSLRKYFGAKDLKPIIAGLGVEVISTSRGIMTANEARKKHLGGEVICRFY
ncbi:30S ribosomal protein S8 [candidate division WWE3 bacterium CG_4_9_14_0_2_um_filter_35_11]|uniref:Small ribosomal subunit protein uS8 n=1 Tax=candidate division WWE3 bacterium CG_4_9_14_0_2_um_filter_35_11 TaxID=1975077 RepID=A0A2M8EKU6_UNCKA|nr:MAG: 30S ribosomal protein S8 [candidate division WWE3 bacterium CG10_big_fil_rev_8_21_14_0_10_35_32]PJC23361.1 MAG: 30S ribosomal protein S8 [candidate division WWE3 bacterium CG_4_9_14_0_2_um_filter_35_11]